MANEQRRASDESPWGVYVHVPFCASRCAYCDFNTYSGMDSHAGGYFRALEREMRAFWDARGVRGVLGLGCAGGERGTHGARDVQGGRGTDSADYADTIFIGGGTPSYVDAEYVTRIAALIPRPEALRGAGFELTSESSFGSPSDSPAYFPYEFTIEANPGVTDAAKLKAYAGAGINRLSFGLQSTHGHHLKMLGRIHSYEDFLNSFRTAKNAGLENVSVDLLFGLPGQTLGEWRQSVETAVSLGIRHLSCYSLSIEEGTPLHKSVACGELPEPDDGLDREMYAWAAAYLRSEWIFQYELSNFASPGYECRHNIKYWTGGRYRGFGAGAHSYDGCARFSNVADIPGYVGRMNGSYGSNAARAQGTYSQIDTDIECGARQGADMAAATEYTAIDAAEREKEYIILRLRLTRGFNDSHFQETFGHNFIETYADAYRDLISSGLLEISPDADIRLTAKGMDFANQVFMKFI